MSLTSEQLILAVAYAKAELKRLTTSANKLEMRMGFLAVAHEKLQAEQVAAKQRLADLQEKFKVAANEYAEEVRAIRQPPPAAADGTRSTLIAEVARFLREAGRPVTTNEVIACGTLRFNVPMETGADRTAARHMFRQTLRHLVGKGAAIRLADETVAYGRKSMARWQWKGL